MLDVSGVNVSTVNAQCVSLRSFGWLGKLGFPLDLVLATLCAKAHTHTHIQRESKFNLKYSNKNTHTHTSLHHIVFSGMQFTIKMSGVGATPTTIPNVPPPHVPQKLKISGER